MLGFGGKSGPIATVRVFIRYNPLEWFGSSPNPNPEPLWQFGTVANTSYDLN